MKVWDGAAWVNTGGKILQVVSTAKTDTFTTTSATFTAVTGLTASITPSSTSSKILIFAQIAFSLGAGGTGFAHFRFSGGNSGTFVGDASSNRISGVFGGSHNADMQNALLLGTGIYLDSPATTSSITYGVETRQASTGTVFVNRGLNDADSAFSSRGASSITLMEVAG